MRGIQDYHFKEKKALIRTDFNITFDHQGAIADASRIEKTLPTIRKVLADGGSAIIVTHLGRPKGYDKTLSLQQLIPYLTNQLAIPVELTADCIGADTIAKVNNLAPGQVLVLENVRFHTEEEQNDLAFAQELAQLADVYINDAFGALHREHASTYGVPQLMNDKLAGYLLQTEVENADRLLQGYTKPFTVILGGTKVADKLPAVEALLDKIDHLLIGGGMANTFQQAIGNSVGSSIIAANQQNIALSILRQATEKGINLVLPTDIMIADQFNEQAKTRIIDSQTVPEGWMTVDLGPHSQALFDEVIEKSATILWIGPIGVFEIASFSEGTKNTLSTIARATHNNAFSFVGGGDSATATVKFGFTKHVSFISTGGSALLHYLSKQSLPCLKVLDK